MQRGEWMTLVAIDTTSNKDIKVWEKLAQCRGFWIDWYKVNCLPTRSGLLTV